MGKYLVCERGLEIAKGGLGVSRWNGFWAYKIRALSLSVMENRGNEYKVVLQAFLRGYMDLWYDGGI